MLLNFSDLFSVKKQNRKLQWFITGSFALHILTLYAVPIFKMNSAPVIPGRIEVELVAISNVDTIEQPISVKPIAAKLAKTVEPSVNETTIEPTFNNRVADTSEKVASGDAVTLPSFNAVYLNNSAPVYPLSARRAGYEGGVIIRARIQVNGIADSLEITKSSGYHVLDRAALNAVKQWRFVPAHRGNETIAEWVDIPLRFKLEDS